MEYTVSGRTGHINLSAAGAEEIIQNVRMILSTLREEVPLDRSFARTGEALDKPLPQAVNAEISALYRAIKRHEPRAEVTQIRFIQSAEQAMGGALVPEVKIKIKEGAL